MLKLSAFADEISPDLDEQIRVCRGERRHPLRAARRRRQERAGLRPRAARRDQVEARRPTAWASSASARRSARSRSTSRGRSISTGSRSRWNRPSSSSAPFIRVFSYYPAGGEGKGPHRPAPRRGDRPLPPEGRVPRKTGRRHAGARERERHLRRHRPALPRPDAVGRTRPSCAARSTSPTSCRSAKTRCETGRCSSRTPPTSTSRTPSAHGGKVVPAGKGDGEIRRDPQRRLRRAATAASSALEPHLKVAGHSPRRDRAGPVQGGGGCTQSPLPAEQHPPIGPA